jgi:Tfp pilus assembly protein PilF
MKTQFRAWVALVGLTCGCPAAGQQASDWQSEIRQRIAAHQLDDALSIAERRLAEAPQDMEARGWRARLLAWSGQWREAETEYRRVLETNPHDVDLLLGLASVLSWEKRFEEAIPILEQAQQLEPKRTDVCVTLGRDYSALGSTDQAREAFRKALALDPSNATAQAGLASLVEEPRYQLRFGADIDTFNYTDTAWAYTTSLRAQISSRWVANVSGGAQQRFGKDAGRFLSSVTYQLTRRDALTVGGGVAHDQGVVPKAEGFFEYGHGFHLGTRGMVRGLEASYHQHWFWFEGAHVLALTPSILFYFPREWTWSVQVTAARSRFSGLAAEWRPSGLTRLSFPLYRRLSGNVFYGVGTENFALADQIGRFSARTFGGGARYRFAQRQELAGYVFAQDRSQGQSQISFGFSYAIRF